MIIKRVFFFIFIFIFCILLINQLLLFKSKTNSNELRGIDRLYYKNNTRAYFIIKNNNFNFSELKNKMNYILDLKEFQYFKIEIKNGKKQKMDKKFILDNMILSSNDVKLLDFLNNDFNKSYIWCFLYDEKDKALHAIINHTTISGILVTKLMYELNKQQFYKLKSIHFYPILLEISCILAGLKYYRMEYRNLKLNIKNPKFIKYKIPLIKNNNFGATVTINYFFKDLFLNSFNSDIQKINVANMFAFKNKSSYKIMNQQSFFVDTFEKNDKIENISTKILSNKNLMIAYAYLPFIFNNFSIFHNKLNYLYKLDICISSIKLAKGGYTLDMSYNQKSSWPIFVCNSFNGENIEGTILIKNDDINIKKLIKNIKSYGGDAELIDIIF